MPWHSQIFIAKCLYSYRDDLPKNLLKITAQVCKKSTSGWPALLKNVAAYAVIGSLRSLLETFTCRFEDENDFEYEIWLEVFSRILKV